MGGKNDAVSIAKRDNLPSIRYGTEVKSALKSMKVTTLFPWSIISPNVGHALDANDADDGAYDNVSRPTDL